MTEPRTWPGIVRIALIGLLFFGIFTIWPLYNIYVPIFLQSRFGLTADWIGVFMTLDNFAALLIQPAVGAWSDRVHTRLGRRLPFILAAAPVSALTMGLLPSATVLPAFVVCSLILVVSMAIWRTPATALMPDLTPSARRTQANGIIQTLSGVGAIVAAVVSAQLYERNPLYPFWFAGAAVMIVLVLALIVIREPAIGVDVAPESARASWQAALGAGGPRRLFLALFCAWVAFSAVEAFGSLFATNYLGLTPADSGRLVGQFALALVLAAVPAGYLAARVGRQRLVLAAMVLWGVAQLAGFLVPAAMLGQRLGQVPVFGTLFGQSLVSLASGLAWGVIPIVLLPVVMDLTATRQVGAYVGLYFLFATLASIVAPPLSGVLATLSGSYRVLPLVASVSMWAGLAFLAGARQGQAQGEAGARYGQSSAPGA